MTRRNWERRHAVAAASGFDPATITGLKLWYDAAHVTQAANIVSAIADQSGNARTPTITGVPAYTAANAGYNNRPTVKRTDATDQILTPDLGLTTGGFTFVFVGDAPAASYNYLIRVTGAGVGADLRAQGGNFRATEDGGATELDFPATTTAPSVVIAVFNGASSRVYASALTPVTGTTGAQPDMTGQAAYVGDIVADGSGNLNFTHVLVYTGALSNANCGILLTGFGTESGITIGA